MENRLELFVGLLLAGIVLLGAEIYLPGGIVGVIGAYCLLGAAIAAWGFAPPWNIVAIAGIAIVLALGIYFWVKIFPRTRAGRRLTLEADGRQFKSNDPGLASLLGCEGEAQSALRPSGIALIDGRRVDVLTEEGWIDAGSRIKVVAVQGSRVIVRRLATETPPAPRPS